MESVFARPKALIGMVHVRALPGTPRNSKSIDAICEMATKEAGMLAGAGFDAILIENMHDVPYLRGNVGPEIVASMTRVGLAVRQAAGDTPVGVQVLAAANCEAIAVAQAIGASFVRVENFVFAHVADEGLMDEASAGPLLRYRKRIGADDIAIFADIKKKHAAHTLTGDVSLAEVASAAAFSGASGVIVTGGSTGNATSLTDIRAAKGGSHLPVLVGSGANADTIQALLQHADGVIVGSALKVGGKWSNEMDYDAVKRLAKAARKDD